MLIVLTTDISQDSLYRQLTQPLHIFLRDNNTQVICVRVNMRITPHAQLLHVDHTNNNQVLLHMLMYYKSHLTVHVLTLRLRNSNIASYHKDTSNSNITVLVQTKLTLQDNMNNVNSVIHVRNGNDNIYLRQTITQNYKSQAKVINRRCASLTTKDETKDSLTTKGNSNATKSLILMNTIIGINNDTKRFLHVARINSNRTIILRITILSMTFRRRTKVHTAITRVLQDLIIIRNVTRIIRHRGLHVLPEVHANVTRLTFLNRLQLTTTKTSQTIRMRQRNLKTKASRTPTRNRLPLTRTNKFPVTVKVIVVQFRPESGVTQTNKITPVKRNTNIRILQVRNSTRLTTMKKYNSTTTILTITKRRLYVITVTKSKVLRRFTMLRLHTVIGGSIPVLKTIVLIQRFSILNHVRARPIRAIISHLRRRVIRRINNFNILDISIVRTRRLTINRLVTIIPVLRVAIVTIIIMMLKLLPAVNSNTPDHNRVINCRVSSSARTMLIDHITRTLRVVFNARRPITSNNINQLVRMMPILNRSLTLAAIVGDKGQLNLRKNMAHFNGNKGIFLGNFRTPLPYIRNNTLTRLLHRSMVLTHLFRHNIFGNINMTITVNTNLYYNTNSYRSTRNNHHDNSTSRRLLTSLRARPVPNQYKFPVFRSSFIPC